MAHISEAGVKTIREICDRYADDKTPLMMILSDIQNEYGYIPLEVQQIVSEKTGISVAEIYGVVTFYSFFSLEPKGKYVIGCCMGTACYVKGAQQIIDKFSEILGIAPGETTADGLFTIDALRCIGACGIAPAVSINSKVYPKMTVDMVAPVIEEYRAMGRCNRMRTFEELNAKIASCTEALEEKVSGSNGKRAILLCGGTGCLSSDSMKLKERFEELIREKGMEEKVTVNIVGCFGFCSQGPFVKIFPEDTLYRLVRIADVEEIFKKDILENQIVEHLLYVDPATKEKVVKQDDINFYKKQKRIALHGCGVINPENIEEAIGKGAFQGLKRALTMKPAEVIEEVLASGLRGRGGGGFPAGRKWSLAYTNEADQKYVVCNGDEGDPGAFMDRSILEGNPFAVLEGMMIAGYAIGASEGYFYVRAEYPIAVNRLRGAIKQMNEAGILGENILGSGFSFQAHIRLGAGAFVCGEETALLNSIEGKRGMPRPRPPFPAVKGLWEKPTIVNNVETLACVPYILREGAEVFAGCGTDHSKGTKVFALGGKVNNVGLVEIPMGMTLRELIFDIGGGIPEDKEFKAIQTGGPSGGCLPSKYLDEPIDFDNLVAKGSMMGSGGAIVMDEDNCMVDVAKFYMEFICDESCGKCSPCRIGTKRMLEILTRITEGSGTMQDLEELEELGATVKSNSLCALGQTAANPIISTLTHFRDEYLAHIVDKKCPAKVCKNLMRYRIIQDSCVGCGMCAKVCPADCIEKTDYIAPGKKLPSYQIDASKCVKCGACMATCKLKAIEKR